MKAVINMPGNGTTIPAGKSIDLVPIREFVEQYNLCNVDDALELLRATELPDMDYSELKTFLKKHYMQNYSQNNEQSIILDFFKDFKGTFLDIGANDGKTLSNTYALVLGGWSGLLVEASPTAYGRLLENMPFENDLTMLNVAVGSYDGEIILHESGELLGKGDVALVSSTREDEVHRWDSLNIPFVDKKVTCVTFKKLLEQTKFKKFDFISIDIEGMELDVLPQMDFNELDCRLACIEFNGKEQEKYDAIMLPFGFTLIHQNAENLIYGKAS